MPKIDPKTKELETKVMELTDKLARALADYANLEKRIESQRQLYATLAVSSMLNKTIPVLDDLYLAQTHLKDSGLQIALDKFRQLIKAEGIEEINPLNQEFDPQTMHCLDSVEGKENQVVSVKKIGYKLNDQILRPAEVVVGKLKV